MKTRKLVTALLFAGLSLLLISCTETISKVEESFVALNAEKSVEDTSTAVDSCTFTDTLTKAEIEGLLEMREEEKLARDVYRKFYELYNIPVFNNISKSENAHTSAVLHLLTGYAIEDPAKANEGEFSNPIFTGLYKSLIEKGSVNLNEALKVGAYIEEYDIADLRRLLKETQNEDIKRVYGNLLRGSTFHIRAFTNLLGLRGETYEPTIITSEEYLEIIEGQDKD